MFDILLYCKYVAAENSKFTVVVTLAVLFSPNPAFVGWIAPSGLSIVYETLGVY